MSNLDIHCPECDYMIDEAGKSPSDKVPNKEFEIIEGGIYLAFDCPKCGTSFNALLRPGLIKDKFTKVY